MTASPPSAPRPTGKWRYRGPLDSVDVGDCTIARDESFEIVEPVQLPAGVWEIVPDGEHVARQVRLPPPV